MSRAAFIFLLMLAAYLDGAVPWTDLWCELVYDVWPSFFTTHDKGDL